MEETIYKLNTDNLMVLDIIIERKKGITNEDIFLNSNSKAKKYLNNRF
jgi:hypothetical protein